MSENSSSAIEIYLVTGGTGLLGYHIVRALVARGEQRVSVFSLHAPPKGDQVEDVTYYQGDIADEAQVRHVLAQTAATTVFHTTSILPGQSAEIYHRVNVIGVRILITACHAEKVQKLIYTSSTGVVWKNSNFQGISEEEAKIPTKGYDPYHHTKAIGENLVLNEDGVDGLRTVALRPCLIFGPRDRRLMASFAQMHAKGRHNIQIGDNASLVDVVYAGNAADAHLLAADLLPSPSSASLAPSTGTSPSSSTQKTHLIAGQVFFITNGTPVRPYDFARLFMKELGDDGSKKIVKVPRLVALALAFLAEAWGKVTGGHTRFTRFAVRMMTDNNWFNIDKAQNLLGYKPKVNVEDAVKLTVEWWKQKEAEKSLPQS